MSKRPSTKRELDAQLQALLAPPPMSLEQALATENPVGEIGIRLSGKSYSSMSEPERVFWSVTYFAGDTQNGGLHQALTNDTGELLPLFAEFAKRYGSPELVALFERIAALFPSGQVPSDREERCRAIAEVDLAALDHLTESFYGCDSAITKGLIALATKNAAQFDLGGWT